MYAPPMLTIRDALARSSEWLAERGTETSRLDAEVLLGHVLGMQRLDLYLAWDRPLSNDEKDRYRECLRRRAAHEPVAYITGTREFYSIAFRVSPSVLIPRPDTEHLVARALEILKTFPSDQSSLVADIGTGSGAIAIAVASHCPSARFIATDISPDALDVARCNAERLGLDNRIRFIEADLLEGVEETFDLVVSNPPYIAETDRPTLAPDVRDFEPSGALFSGPDGLDAIRRLIPAVAERLRPGGWLAMEVGAGQSQLVANLLDVDGRYEPAVIALDYAKIERVVSAKRK
jgi:release factor glutamine methyltransferase